MNQEPIIIEKTYDASIDKVWKAISDKNEMKKWYFDLAEFKPEVGFEFQFSGGPSPEKQYLHLCKITEVIVNKKLSYTWLYDGYSGDSLVIFELFVEGDKTRLKLSHFGLESFPMSNPDFERKNFVAGWSHIVGVALTEFLNSEQDS